MKIPENNNRGNAMLVSRSDHCLSSRVPVEYAVVLSRQRYAEKAHDVCRPTAMP